MPLPVCWLIPLLSAIAANVAANVDVDVNVVIDAANATHAISPEMLGCHFSPLNHQLAWLGAQMLYDESFEQAVTDKHPLPDGQTSLGWSAVGSAVRGANGTRLNGTSPLVHADGSAELKADRSADNHADIGANIDADCRAV